MLVKEIECKSILTPTTLKSLDYTINPYFGCTHGCVYCYCRELSRRFHKHEEPWGEFIDVKKNAADILRKDLRKNPQGIVWLSSTTDAYQPIEDKYKLTRGLLEGLLDSQLKVDILSKGALVTRDIDLFKRFGDRITVGFTINTLDDSFRKHSEPGAAPIGKRIEQLAQLRDEGVPRYASFGPVFPEFTDAEALFKTFKELGITYTFTESFNTRGENWTEVKRILEQNYPELLPKYERIFFDKDEKARWHGELQKQIDSLSQKYGIKCDTYFVFREKFK